MKVSESFSRWMKRSFACSMLLVLPSCQIPCLRQPDAAPPVPTGFDRANNAGPNQPAGFRDANSSENSACLGVDEFFGDPALTFLIDQALAGNRELKILNEEIQIARNDILYRRGQYLPFVSYGARAGVEKNSQYTPLGAAEEQLTYPGEHHFPDPVPNFMGSLNLFWQLDIWRELRNARDAAAQRYVAACEKRNDFVTRMVADIAENYYTLMALDKRLENLDQTTRLQEQSLEFARSRKEAGRDTELAVQRFQAEVRKNKSEILIVRQEIIEAENRINLILNRFPQPVEFTNEEFLDLNLRALQVGIPAQLLRNRPDIRQAERELAAAGLDVKVARAHFYPRLDISAGVGLEAFNPKYLFSTPESLIYHAAADLAGPLINRKAIQAEYMSANARQLQAVYNYQLVLLTAFTEVVNYVAKADNYTRSIEVKKQQLESLEASVDAATKLFQNARAEYVEVLLAQRDLRDARMGLIDTKNEQLSAIVNAYQALGGGNLLARPRHRGDKAGEEWIPLSIDAVPPSKKRWGIEPPPRNPAGDEDMLPLPPAPGKAMLE
ncbi:MAG: efflux transporter outer membrane subunit [Planctomycetaceae bacterium]|nr:efflux transporter outer membrane subunit [Planctomycetaceae bacterium]